MSTFRAFRVHERDGGCEGRLDDIGLDELSPGDVTIRAAWSGINYKDALAVTGKGRIMRRFPMVAGVDVSGTVESSSDPRFAPGDRVLVAGPTWAKPTMAGMRSGCGCPPTRSCPCRRV